MIKFVSNAAGQPLNDQSMIYPIIVYGDRVCFYYSIIQILNEKEDGRII